MCTEERTPPRRDAAVLDKLNFAFVTAENAAPHAGRRLVCADLLGVSLHRGG